MIKITKHRCLLDGPRTHIYYSAYFEGYEGKGRTEWDAVNNLISESIDVISNTVEAGSGSLEVWWLMCLGNTKIDVGHFGLDYLLMCHAR